jgi:hypothetical protein
METCAHHRLKALALTFLRSQGCLAYATEVRCPISKYRIDAVGWCDTAPLDQTGVPRQLARRTRRRRIEPTTIIIECKQSRADFLRDNERTEQLLEYRSRLHAIRRSIEEHRIKTIEPELRLAGTSLFSELDDWNFDASRLRSYRRVLRTLERIDAKLHGETKFLLIARYRLADRLFVAAPRGMVRPAELPPGWGLLECPPEWLSEEEGRDRGDPSQTFGVTIESPINGARPERRIRLLRNIAIAARRLGATQPASDYSGVSTGPLQQINAAS